MVSHRYAGTVAVLTLKEVLILIVMDNGLSRGHPHRRAKITLVLILIVMDNGLSRGTPTGEIKLLSVGLNPYCNG